MDDDEVIYQRLGTRKPFCTLCWELNIHVLTGSWPSILCYECERRVRGWTPLEMHHPAGQHNSPATVRIPANDHRFLSHLQNTEWPMETLRNPDGSPLRRAAAAIRGWLDVLRLIIERTVGWVPGFLEKLDGALTSKLGASWWGTLGMEDAS
jgi:hypothetical protein